MSEHRYSIIPGGAVTDPNLEPRDLQVLCLLGRHTNRLGWCHRSQGKMAEEIRSSRSSVQRSLVRLYEAGWVERKLRSVGRSEAKPDRPHTYHAYRVKIDRECLPDVSSEFAVDEAEGDERCSPVGTPNPPVGTGCPPMRGHHECPPMNEVVVEVARASLVSAEAMALAEEIATMAGLPDPMAWPPGWCGAPMRVQAFLTEGYHPDILRVAAREVMAGKRDGPPHSISYFERPFAKARARHAAPLPIIETRTNPEKVYVDRPRSALASLAKIERDMRDRGNPPDPLRLPKG